MSYPGFPRPVLSNHQLIGDLGDKRYPNVRYFVYKKIGSQEKCYFMKIKNKKIKKITRADFHAWGRETEL